MPRNRIATSAPLSTTVRGPRSADSADLNEQFPGTPAANDYDSAASLAIFQECLSGVQVDNVEFEQGVDMDYAAAPDIPGDVDVAGDSTLANAFVPNPATPATGNPNDFTQWDGIDEWAEAQKVEQFPIGYGGTSSRLTPSVSSAAIGTRTISETVGSGGPTESV